MASSPKAGTKTAAARARARAARRGWETRRAREAARKRSEAARKGWETRRAAERKAAEEKRKRSEAARKGWETRRAKAKGGKIVVRSSEDWLDLPYDEDDYDDFPAEDWEGTPEYEED